MASWSLVHHELKILFHKSYQQQTAATNRTAFTDFWDHVSDYLC